MRPGYAKGWQHEKVVSPLFVLSKSINKNQIQKDIFEIVVQPFVRAPRKLMWASWLIQPGQSLTSIPEQNFACRAVTNCVKPKGWRIVGHNESEGIKY